MTPKRERGAGAPACPPLQPETSAARAQSSAAAPRLLCNNWPIVDVSVIVPARDASKTIGATLQALADQDYPGEYEVVVADDGSRDETAAIAAAAGAKVVRQPRLGPGQARNLAVRASCGRILAFTDADCRPAPSWLRRGVEALESADLVQGKVVREGDPETAFDHSIEVTRESGLYETANLFTTRELYERVGGFEDWLEVRVGKRLGEDVWFGWTARRAGARTAFCDRAVVVHAWIRRGGKEYVRDRLSRFYYPALVAKVPELRRTLLVARVFLTPQSAAFAAAAAAMTVAVVLGLTIAPWAALPPLPGAIPYAVRVFGRARLLRRYAPRVAAVEVVADGVSCLAMLAGSLRFRTLVL